jgi:hypothetical protein
VVLRQVLLVAGVAIAHTGHSGDGDGAGGGIGRSVVPLAVGPHCSPSITSSISPSS